MGFEPEDYVPPEERDTHFFAHIQDRTYPRWNSSTFTTEYVESKHHLVKVQTETGDEENICFGPAGVCSHADYTREQELVPISKGIQEGETSQEQICKHCWERLPSEKQDELSSLRSGKD